MTVGRPFAVAPAERGHGIGAVLVRACIDRARAAGAELSTAYKLPL